MGNSVTKIGYSAFSGCSGLTSVIIPNSVTSIWEYAFSRCSGLTSVTIGNLVTSIRERAFAECSNLEVVYCYATDVPSTDNNVFGSYIESATLYVPSESINKYKSEEPWRNFGTIIGITTDVTSVRDKTLIIQSEDGRLTITGADEGTPISVYDTSGKMVGFAISSIGTTSVYTSLKSGDIGIVKIGDNVVKVQIR